MSMSSFKKNSRERRDEHTKANPQPTECRSWQEQEEKIISNEREIFREKIEKLIPKIHVSYGNMGDWLPLLIPRICQPNTHIWKEQNKQTNKL